jgi:hypothetical protein
MNWATFFLNQFLIDCEEAQDKGTKFHYAWLLIPTALSSWRELYDTQFLGVKYNPCLAARYQNLWHTTHKVRQLENNVDFYIYKETIQKNIQSTPCIPPQVVEEYKPIARFKAGCHHMYVQARDSNQEWLPTLYRLTEEDMGHIMEDWVDDWKIPTSYTKQTEKKKPKLQDVDDDEEEGEE